jgi:hypothetical protein
VGGADKTELQLKGNTVVAWWKQQQLWPPCMCWQTSLTSKLQLTLWTQRTKYHSQASNLVRPHKSSCLYINTRIGHLRNNSRTFTKRLNFLLLLYLVFFVVFFFCTVNFIITIFLCLFLPPHFLSFSCATIHCYPSQLLFLPLLSSLSSLTPAYPPQLVSTLPLPPT